MRKKQGQAVATARKILKELLGVHVSPPKFSAEEGAKYLTYLNECRTEAFREMNIYRLAPYEIEGEGQYSKQLLRFWFLQTISQEAPIVWEELRDGAYAIYYELGPPHDVRDRLHQIACALAIPVSNTLFDMPDVIGLETNAISAENYEKLIEAGVNVAVNPHNSDRRSRDDFIYWEALNRADEVSDCDLLPLRESLVAWARKHNLNAEWVLDWTLRMMHLWRVREVIPHRQTCGMVEVESECNTCPKHCIYLLNSFDANRIAVDEMSAFPFPLPGTMRGHWISRTDYLRFVVMKAVDQIQKSQFLSLADKSAIERFIGNLLMKADDIYSRALPRRPKKFKLKKSPISHEHGKVLKWTVQKLILKYPYNKIYQEAKIHQESLAGIDDELSLQGVERAVRRELDSLDLSKSKRTVK